MSGVGHNGADAELQRRIQRRVEALDEIAELQEQVKEFKADDKAAGYDEKALGHVIKELRGGPDKQAANLELEEVVDVYRRAAGLPTTLETAQAEQRKNATIAPEPKKPRHRKDLDG